MDTLTKYAYLKPYKEAFTTEDLAYIFNKIVIARHGIPDKIVSDRDKLFTSQFWQSLMDQIGTKTKAINIIPPPDGRTNGKDEPNDRTIPTLLS